MEHSEREGQAPHGVLAARVKALRKKRGFSAEGLANAMTEQGIPWTRTVVAKLETGRRPGVNAEELLTLALVLDVSPATLLLPPEDSGEEVRITPRYSTSWQAAWRWVTGEQPLTDEPLPLADERIRAYVRENRPYEQSPFIREVSRLLQVREPAPWRATIRWDGVGKPVRSFVYGTDGEGDGER